jgi:hypothetical protein
MTMVIATTQSYSKHEFHYGTSVIKYSLIKSRRIKTSELIVDRDEVVIRTPFDKPDHEIQKLFTIRQIGFKETERI